MRSSAANRYRLAVLIHLFCGILSASYRERKKIVRQLEFLKGQGLFGKFLVSVI
jgi:hypothetical protein